MNEEIPHGSKCDARTRAGGNCRRALSPGRPRCNLHGGKSLAGHIHPRFKHGLYSKYAFLFLDRERMDVELERIRGVRERRDQREANYVNPRLEAWLARHQLLNARSVKAYLAQYRNLKREYQERLAARREKYRAKRQAATS
jgi:hypothetical protein